MKIAVWGSCNYGNYGDDIMVLMYSRYIKEQGATPVAYRLDKNLAARYGIETVFTLQELVQGASFAMIAGGSWLEKHKFDDKTFGFESNFVELLEVLEAHQCPLYSLSIGGDGHTDPAILTEARQALFSSNVYKGGSVRLPQDVQLLKALGKDVALFPDVVLSLPKFWTPKPAQGEHKKGLRIGFQLTGAAYGVFKTINWISWAFPNEYIFFNSHLPEYNFKYELSFTKTDNKRKNFSYEDPQSLIDFISGLDALVSFKLHPSVTAVSYGVPFFLLGGLDKTKNFLKSIQAEGAISDVPTIKKYLLTNSLVRNAKSHFNWNLVHEQQKQSFAHFDLLKSLIAQYASTN